MTRRAELGSANVFGFGRHKPARRVHDGRVAAIDDVWSEDRPPANWRDRVDDESAIEAGAVAESIALDLMTCGARHAVGGKAVERFGAALRRKAVEDSAAAAGRFRGEAFHRHVA